MSANGPASLLDIATAFRAAIERSIAERTTPHLPYFPDGACRMVSRLFAMHLQGRGGYAVRLVSAHIPGAESYVRHTWAEIDGTVVDLAADPFGLPPVVVGPPTAFHDSLDARDEVDAAAAIAAFSDDEANRCRRLLGPIERLMA